MDVVAIVAAAGRGERFGGTPKQFQRVAGRTLLEWSLARLAAASVGAAVVAVPEALIGSLAGSPAPDGLRVTWVAGGGSRQESVALALAAAPATRWVLVHDAARAAVDPRDVRRTLDAAAEADGAVLGRAVVDTLKRLEGDRIAATVDRAGLFRAETPQVVRRDLLVAAFAAAATDGFAGTDEASLVERLGARLVAVEAAFPNPKVTRPGDLALLRSLLGAPA